MTAAAAVKHGMWHDWLATFLAQLDLSGAILLGFLVAFGWTMMLAQRAPGFDIKQVMLDDNGKVSYLRLVPLGAFAVHSWALMKDALSQGGVDPVLYAIYGAIWSGAPIAVAMIEALKAKWTK